MEIAAMPGRGRESLKPVPAPPIERLLRPFREFARLEAAGGLLLLATTLVALLWANSPWASAYHALWHLPLTVGVGGFALSEDLHSWINDGLMVIFFLVVGLEIKREVLVGELASLRPPAAGASPWRRTLPLPWASWRCSASVSRWRSRCS